VVGKAAATATAVERPQATAQCHERRRVHDTKWRRPQGGRRRLGGLARLGFGSVGPAAWKGGSGVERKKKKKGWANMSKNHVLVLFELFHSGQKHRTRVGQYMPILALIDKSSPRESRSEFLPRTHPIHSNMSKNHVLAFFELFHFGRKHRTLVCQ
jgi:hypothetical protein